MELKRYQQAVLKSTQAFLARYAEMAASASAKYANSEAWEAATGLSMGYRPRRNGLGKDMPAFCIKVPTGGGKTLLATQILGQIYGTLLRIRNGGGLALWIVPSDQIYRDTLKALRDRRHPYRQSLEFSVGRRIELWEKHEIARLTPTQLTECLNILVFKLASANRETKDQLRMFQDSGGNIVRHFPPEDDPKAHRKLKERVANLDLLGEDLVRTSLANLIRLCEPPVILDEGHKAYSELAQKTLEGFNASILVELSATPPKEANILCKVTGTQLLEEEMIKLPINVALSAEQNWKTCLAKAREKREELSRQAAKFYRSSRRLIRPIVLVQVERTGKDQRDGNYIHSLDVKEHLIQRLGVKEAEIAIKTSDTDDIEGIDLLDEGCPITWIITKQALQEGWDCPFAYILVSLNNTQSELSMTQIVGRILRQPHAKKTGVPELDESYAYCLKKKAGQIMREIKDALEDEGYEGDESSVVDGTGEEESPRQQALFRAEFKRLYRPFEGKVYLPRFCVKEGKEYEGFDYFHHLLAHVDVGRFRYDTINWNVADQMDQAKEVYFRVTLGQQDPEFRGGKKLQSWENDDAARAWIVTNLPFEQYGFKELGRIVESSLARLPGLQGNVGLVKFILRDKIAAFIEKETDLQTHAAFKRLFDAGNLCFYLKCVHCRFELPPEITLKSTRRLVHEDTNTPVERSLFDTVVESSFNDYEKEVALCLDRHPEVLWWFRNEVGAQYFSLQGYKKDKIFPDFVVQKGEKKKPEPTVLVVETKGGHLSGNPDTLYKKDVARYFEQLGKAVSWQKLGEGFEDSTFRFQVLDQGEHNGWREELLRILGER